MKWRFLAIVLFIVAYNTPTEAQIFKKLGDKIEKKVDDRINKKKRQADSEVDRSIDRILDGAEQGVMDAGKEATKPGEGNNQNPDVSQSQAPTGDYVLAMTGSGPDTYLEYGMDTNQLKDLPSNMGDIDMSLHMYASSNTGKSRGEVRMKIPMMGNMNTIVLSDANNQSKTYMLNEKNKTYSVVPSAKNDPSEMAGVTIQTLGTTQMHGLNVTHSKIIFENDGAVFDVWTTKDIPGYNAMMDMYKKSGQMGDNLMWEKLIQAQADGYVVRMELNQGEISTALELRKIERNSFPAYFFEIPAGYKQVNNATSGLFGF